MGRPRSRRRRQDKRRVDGKYRRVCGLGPCGLSCLCCYTHYSRWKVGAQLPGTDPFRDIESAPVSVDGAESRSAVVDWRVLLLLLLVFCCILFSWMNWESEVTLRLLFCGDVSMSVMVAILLSLATGSVVTLLVEAGYRRWRRERRDLEERAAQNDAVREGSE